MGQLPADPDFVAWRALLRLDRFSSSCRFGPLPQRLRRALIRAPGGNALKQCCRADAGVPVTCAILYR